MKLLLRLYPAAWRERYGEELEALMLDVPGGWRGNLDVIKGALAMRMTYHSSAKVVPAFVIFGALAGLLVSYVMPAQWRAAVVLQRVPAQVDDVQEIAYSLGSGQYLGTLIEDPDLDLYRDERRTATIEEIEEIMRQNLRIATMESPVQSEAQIFAIAFQYRDPEKAKATVNALTNMLLRESSAHFGYYLDVLDPPQIPLQPSSPNRALFVASGGLAGLVFAIATILVRRLRKRSLQTA